jgi:VWFA-related protein
MKNIIASLTLVFLCALTNLSQTSTPTPKPAEDDEVVKISTALIQIDVTVTDKDGRVVKDLKPEDFEVYENGKKQEITNFSFVSVDNATKQTLAKSKEKDKISIPLPPVPIKPEQVRRTIALVVDDLGLSFESIYQVRRAMRKFVDEQMQPNDLVAVIRTGSGMGALQQFTTDKRQLYAAIENVKWNALGRAGISAFAPLEATPLEQAQAGGQDVSDEDLAAEQGRIKDFDSFREDVFSIGTLGAINFIVKGLSDLPGRKSIMLFSDGFAICAPDNPDRCSRILDSVKRLTDLSNRASVAIYSFDARGLQTTGLTAADNTSGVNPQRVLEINSSRSAQLFETQEGLSYLARETGGRTFFNSNDINKGLDKALEDQKGYYLVGYQPDAETFDPKTRRFNKLQIKVVRKDTNVRYRSGFFGVSDEQIKPPVTQTWSQQLLNALGSPFGVNDIALRLNTLYGNDAKHGNFVSSFLHVNAKDLKFTDEPDGSKKVVFDVLAVNFGANGTSDAQISKTYTLTVKDEEYRKLLNEGFVYSFTFPVKKAGAYQYRVAIRDTQTQKIGSANQFIEVPNLKKNRLTVSGLVLENLTEEQWEKSFVNPQGTPNKSAVKVENTNDPLAATSLRRFKPGTILRYGYEIYNAKVVAGQQPNLTTQIRMFRDGKMILEGKQIPLDLSGQSDLQRIKATGAINLGSGILPGDYVLQIVVTDALAKAKSKIATQFVQFEIIQ